MDPLNDKNSSNISWWIASLAISLLVCTAFAGYLFDIKADLLHSKTRDDIIEQRLDMLAGQVDNLRRREIVQQIQVVPPPPDTNIQLPEVIPPTPGKQPSAALPQAQESGTPAPAPAPAEPPASPKH